jgi:hypothetical protein
MRRLAKLYLEAGYSVIPMGANKRPSQSWLACQGRMQLSDGEYNGIAIVTGYLSDCVVVDCDNEDAFQSWCAKGIESGLTVKTKRGYHCYFRYCDGARNRVGVLPGVDVRAEGGYVLAPPSFGRYRVISGSYLDRDNWPHYSLDWFPRPEIPKPKKLEVANLSRYMMAVIDGEVQRVVKSGSGGRNYALNTAAYNLGKYIGTELDYQTAFALMREAGLSVGLGQVEVEQTVRSGLSGGSKKPRVINLKG